MKVVNPFADAWTDEYSVFDARTRRVDCNAALRNFLGAAVGDGLRPVLVTRDDAVVTVAARAAMQDSAAFWAVRSSDGWLWDANVGYRLTSIDELWRGPQQGADRHPAYTRPAAAALVDGIGFDAYLTHAAAEETRLGGFAEQLIAGFGASPFDRWGREEPLADAWDAVALTARIRAEMPESQPYHLAAPDGTWARIRAARTSTGLVERVTGVIPAGTAATPGVEDDASWPVSRAAMTDTMRGLVERFTPLAAMVTSGAYVATPSGLAHLPGASGPPRPLAMLLGPRAVRDLGVSVDALSDRHDVIVLGPGRVPSMFLQLSRPDPLWRQLRAFMHDLDAEREAMHGSAPAGGGF